MGGGPGISFSQQQPQVRVLTLNHGDHMDSTLFRLQKGMKQNLICLNIVLNL